LTFPRYSPPILDSMNTTKGASFHLDQSEPNQSGQSETKNDTLIRMESALKAEREKLQKNQAELIKLQRLAQNADVSFLLVFFKPSKMKHIKEHGIDISLH